ncbi:YggS family pyridoxal phosphate-dependent enzyme [Agaribacter flavus]|uniref:Pyridoxal phosphate homeostasis protein n=1 Tax=Agaribacter flavus TaxID=1902781 RepID=A0ABV7FPY4_9ALTE
MSINNAIAQNLKHINQQIHTAASECSRSPNDIHLLAVSKTKPVSDVILAYEAGHRNFGENYAQEGVDKIQSTRHLPDIVWHFIGPLQSNKSKLIAENFDWMHSLSRLKIAKRLDAQRPSDMPALNVCVQVNIDNDPNKAGVMPDEALDLVASLQYLPNLRCRGLMTIPQLEQSEQQLAQSFAKMHSLFLEGKNKFEYFDTLSMGMSSDLHLAISQGSTMLRIGTGIFGARVPK